jgi:hypothetical protein
MADAVTATYLFSGRNRKILHLTSISDGTGESAVVKADISALTYGAGNRLVPTYTSVQMIEYNIQGMSSVRLHWDHDTNDVIAVLPEGSGCIDWWSMGGKADPRSTGGTGDIILTTNGHVSGGTYDITIWFKPKGG